MRSNNIVSRARPFYLWRRARLVIIIQTNSLFFNAYFNNSVLEAKHVRRVIFKEIHGLLNGSVACDAEKNLKVNSYSSIVSMV